MISKGNILLILDADIMLSILTHNGRDVIDCITQWIRTILNQAQCNVDGKTITMLVSRTILSDYHTALGRKGKAGLGVAVKIFFEKSISHKIPVQSVKGKVWVLPFIIGDSGDLTPEQKKVKIDKYDKKYVSALNSSLEIGRFSDRLILVASGDYTSSKGMGRCIATISPKQRDRIQVATNDEIRDKLVDP